MSNESCEYPFCRQDIFSSLKQLRDHTAPSLSDLRLKCLAEQIPQGEVPEVLALVTKALVDGHKITVSPKSRGFFEPRRGTIVLLTDTGLWLLFIGTKPFPAFLHKKQNRAINLQGFEREAICRVAQINRLSIEITFNDTRLVKLKNNWMSTRKVILGIDVLRRAISAKEMP